MEELRECVERGFAGFAIYYQPQIVVDTQELYGAEALARWKSVKYGNVSPIEFIPLLEKSGLIIEFGAWIFYHAAMQCKEMDGAKKRFPDEHKSIVFTAVGGRYCGLYAGDAEISGTGSTAYYKWN